jgi:ribonuclease BN (tRNA processing enzyme)
MLGRQIYPNTLRRLAASRLSNAYHGEWRNAIMLTLTFLGVGSAFAKRNHQSNVLIEAWNDGNGPNQSAANPATTPEPDDTLLIDLGGTGNLALDALKNKPGFSYLNRDGIVDYRKIRRIFITHQHADHIAGLEELCFTNVFIQRDPETGKAFKPQIVSSMNILVNLWDTSLKGGMSPMPGRYALLQDFFFILALRPTAKGYEPFQMLKRYQFEIFPTDHIRVERKYDWPSYGMIIRDTKSDETVFFSGDTKYDFETYGPHMTTAKINFHDAQLIPQENPVHALISELRDMPDDIKQKTHLYHYGDSWDAPEFNFVPDEFAGFATPQTRYTLFE